MKRKPAFTLVELLVSLALVAIIAVPSLLAVRQIRLKQALAASTETLVAVLKRAHIFARESKENKSWGVKYKDNYSYTLVSGNLNAWIPEAEIGLESPVFFESGPFVIWFDQGTGGTPENADLVIKTPTDIRAKISVSQNGIIEAK